MNVDVIAMNDTIRCPYCVDGVWYKDNNYKEGYGEPYRPGTISCEVCNGSKAILKSERSRTDLETITEKQREEILKKMEKK